jgi:hypothetical protein
MRERRLLVRALVTGGTCILAAILLGTAGADVIHTLASPNEAQSGLFGFSVSGAGDVNGDGYSDLLVGAPMESTFTAPSGAGKAYVFCGQTGDSIYGLVCPDTLQVGYFGHAVSGAGDVDDDGYADMIVGAYGASPGLSPDGAGRAYVFSGQTGDTIFTLISPNAEEDGYFGFSLSGAGDVDGDGYADVIVGAYRENPDVIPADGGRAYVFSGATGDLVHTLASPNEQVLGYFGFAVSGAGDADGDGYDDVVVGAHKEIAPEASGRAYVFSGATGTVLDTLVSPDEAPLGEFGFSVSGAGDVNNDGYDDVIVGAPLEGPATSPPNRGHAYVFSGNGGSLLYALESPVGEAFGYFGFSVAGAGDVDNDDCDDVIVGAYGESPAATPDDVGLAYVFAGREGTLLATLGSPNEEYNGFFGVSVSGAGDVNGDGWADVVVGACFEDPGVSPEDAGRAYAIAPVEVSVPDGPVTPPHARLRLEGPYPNPTAGPVELMLLVPANVRGQIALGLYDTAGRLVERMHPGTAEAGVPLSLTWERGPDIAPGLYWWRLRVGEQEACRRMVLVR